MNTEQIISELKQVSNKEYAAHHARFFKTGKGEYGEGDLFYGIRVPDVRKIAKKHYKNTSLEEINQLIKNPYHEMRLTALVMLVLKYPKSSEKEQEAIYNLYLNNINHINNWDLVDISAQYIVGPFVYKNNSQKLFELAKTDHLWSQRVAIIASFYHIRQGEISTTLKLAEHFLNHKHDLIHKATGWMLRETGKKDINTLYAFLDKFNKQMPRTMLRYSIEKFTPDKKKHYMQK